MAEFSEALSDKHVEFIRAQKMFFVATAPAVGSRFPNLSPKGYDALHILAPNRLAYVDLPGSGNQTASHMAQGAAVTFMFCGFESQTSILRVYGRGHAVAPGAPEFEALSGQIEYSILGNATRQIFDIKIEKVQTSCGYGVPRYDFKGDRPTLVKYFDKYEENGKLTDVIDYLSQPQENV